MSYLIGCILTLFSTTVLTRVVPFVFVGALKDSRKVQALGKALPPAIMVLLCLQCISEVEYRSHPYGIPEIVSSIVVVALHSKLRNALVSIVAGTTVYGVLGYALSSSGMISIP